MADFDQEIDNLELDFSGINPQSAVNSAKTANGLSDFERFVVKNVFDTQPKRRAAYLKRLGYEMSRDGEGYRPIGTGDEFKEIEPGFSFYLQAPFKLFTEKGRKELANEIKSDVGDILFDTVVAGPLIAGGAATGAKTLAPIGAGAGSLVPGVGTAAGGAAGGSLGLILGGAAGNASAEGLKGALGSLFLDEEIPLDVQETLYQSMVSGIFSAAGKGVGDLLKKWKSMRVKEAEEALKHIAIQKSRGQFNQNMMDDFFRNPENYTKEAVKGANKQLLDVHDFIFGTTVENPRSTRELQGGVLKKPIMALNNRADLEMKKLSEMPEANWSASELAELVEGRLEAIKSMTFPGKDGREAIKFFKDKLKEIQIKASKTREGLPEIDPETGLREFTFAEGRQLLKELQESVFKNGPLEGNKKAIPVVRDMRVLADKKAADLGSDLADINAKRSQILTQYRNLQTQLKDGTLQNAFIGDEAIAKNRLKATIDALDEATGTKLSSILSLAQTKAAFERVLNHPKTFGSGSVIKDALTAGLEQAPKTAFRFGTLGSAVGTALPNVGTAEAAGIGGAIGAGVGFVKGAQRGATLASPEALVKQASKIKSRASALADDPATPKTLRQRAINPELQGAQLGALVAPDATQAFLQGQIPPLATTADIGTQLPPGATPTNPEDDEFSDFDNLDLDFSSLRSP